MGSVGNASQLDELSKLCPTILKPGAAEYEQNGSTWSTALELHPQVVVVPPDVTTLSRVIKYLSDSTLDFCIRSTGVGGASARDVCVSMQAFKDFHFDQQTETVTMGAGFTGGDVDELMEKHAPGYAVLTPRCNFVGVAGSALWGGFSWLGNEYGLGNDPQNLLDMHIVLGDGRAIWASEEPDLMWALRGGGANFGAVTALKVQARKIKPNIFHGVILVPYAALQECSKELAKFIARSRDPKVTANVFLQGVGFAMPDQGPRPGIAIMAYDGNGEAHGRSEDGFAWAFRLPGAQDLGCREMTLREINAGASTFSSFKGAAHYYLSAPLIKTIEDDTLVNVLGWYERLVEELPAIGKGSTVGLECMLPAIWESSGSRSATAFPHGEVRYLIQILLGCPSNEVPPNFHDFAQKHIQNAGKAVVGEKFEGEYCPGFLLEWNNPKDVFGENLDKLVAVKTKYDAKNRFNKGVKLVSEKVA